MPKDLSSKKEKAIALRREGKSYGEIMKVLNLKSKGTLSNWFRDLTLPSKAKKRIEKKKTQGYEKGLKHFNKSRTEKIQKENKETIIQSKLEIPALSKNDLVLIGAALYWAEGYKRQGGKSTPYVSFANTDPLMIKVFLRFLREVLRIPENKIKCRVQIHPHLSSSKAVSFWSKQTKIPKDRFSIARQTSRASNRKRKPANRQPHGTAEIRVAGRVNFFRIMGWIEGICNQT